MLYSYAYLYRNRYEINTDGARMDAGELVAKYFLIISAFPPRRSQIVFQYIWVKVRAKRWQAANITRFGRKFGTFGRSATTSLQRRAARHNVQYRRLYVLCIIRGHRRRQKQTRGGARARGQFLGHAP